MSFRAYGLTANSQVDCPGLPDGGDRVPDVEIRLGSVPPELPDATLRGALFEAAPARYLLKLDGVARYLATAGREIVIDEAPGSTRESVRLFLLGAVFGALLHQRRMFPLHGSAVATPRGAVIFTGPSGYGKSTLAAEFVRRGYALITDDVCAMSRDEDVLSVEPGIPRLLLSADVLERMQPAPGIHPRLRPGLDKFEVNLQTQFALESTPLHSVYVLQPARAGEPRIDGPLAGGRKLGELSENTFRHHLVRGLGLEREHFEHLSHLSSQVRVLRAIRPRDGFRLAELADVVERDFLA